MKTLSKSMVKKVMLCILLSGILMASAFPVIRAKMKTVVFVHQLPDQTKVKTKKKIQLALLLDTSNSMDGLIDQAKSSLWNIVNVLTKAKADSLAPDIEIAIYEYGNLNIPKDKDYIGQVSAFTTDLDKISEVLFGLKTYGGDEYCGAVIQKSVQELVWSQDSTDMKVIVIAGNEPFSQGSVNYATACSLAKKNKIFVNTIFCGASELGLKTSWKEGANLGMGAYSFIDQNKKMVQIVTPYDKDIIAMNDSLNDTYIPYNSYAVSAAANQVAQDNNANYYGAGNMASRATFKASSNYMNDKWDLVDAYKQSENVLTNVDKQYLPKEYSALSLPELKEQIKLKQELRDAIKARIRILSKKRDDYIAEQKLKGDDNVLGSAMINSIKKQAMERGFGFADE